jgi:TPR repeat protein
MAVDFVISVRREAMRARKLVGAAVGLLGNWFALTPASAETKDAASFARHLRALAEKGDADSQYKLGTAYDEGLGVSKDYTEAFKWFRLAAEQGQPNSQFRVGDMYMSGDGVAKNDAEAVKWFRKAAEQGLANAQGTLGIMYAKGQAVPQDYVLAYMWLHLATEGNQGGAQFRDAVGQSMTAAQVAEAQKLAREWKALKGR